MRPFIRIPMVLISLSAFFIAGSALAVEVAEGGAPGETTLGGQSSAAPDQGGSSSGSSGSTAGQTENAGGSTDRTPPPADPPPTDSGDASGSPPQAGTGGGPLRGGENEGGYTTRTMPNNPQEGEVGQDPPQDGSCGCTLARLAGRPTNDGALPSWLMVAGLAILSRRSRSR